MLATAPLATAWLGSPGTIGELPATLIPTARIQIANNQDIFHVGDAWTITATILTLSGEEPIDPEQIAMTTIAPNGKQSPLPSVHHTVGVYQASIPLPEPGIWHIGIKTTGPTASQASLIITSSQYG